MSRVLSVLLVLSAAGSPLAAQASQAAAAPADASVAAVRTIWQMITNYVTRSAEMMPEEKYSYRPTPDVRTFGELIGHVAGAQHMICAIALGEKPPAEDAVEKTATTKAALLEAMRSSTAHCDKAFSQSDADARTPANLFGRDVTRFHALVLNATHNGEHYGNLVTYLRINGMVPPSSQGGM
jgi:uncharacterized damage-inducible protein DinB